MEVDENEVEIEICPICGSKYTEALWTDVYKIKSLKPAFLLKGYVSLDENGSFALDNLIDKAAKSQEVQTDDIVLYSFNTELFSKDELKQFGIGEEHIGATCLQCNGSL